MDSHNPSVNEGLVVFVPETPTFSILESKAGGRLRSIGGDVPSVGSANLGPNVLRAGNGFRCGPNMSNGGTWTNFRGDTCGIDLTGVLRQAAQSVQSPLPSRSASTKPKARSKGKFASSIDNFKMRAASVFESRGTPERIRLSTDSIYPVAISDKSPSERIAKIRELKPSKLFPNAGSRKKTLVVTPEDSESEKYIRSLGVTLLREIEEEVSRSGVSEQDVSPVMAALDRRATEIDMGIDTENNLVDVIMSVISKRTGLNIDSDESYVTKAVRSDVNEHGFDIPTLINRVKNRKKNDPKDSVPINVRVVTFSDSDGNKMEVELAMAQMPSSAGLKPLVTFRKVGGKNIDVADIDPDDRIEAAAKRISGILDAKLQGKSTIERVAALGDLHDSLAKVLAAKGRESSLTPFEETSREAIRTVLARNGMKFGSIDDSDVLFESTKTGTLVKKTDKAIVVHAESGGLTPSEEADVMEALKEIFEFLPEPWADTIKKNGINLAFAKRGAAFRAEKRTVGDGSSLISMPHFWTGGEKEMQTVDDFKSTLLHEIMHALQVNNKEMNEAEFIHFMMRSGGDTKGRLLKDIMPDSGYEDDEIAVPDDADNAYMFKIYENDDKTGRPIRISEMSAMLMQALDGRSGRTKGDLDALAWMLGLMLEQGSA